MNFSATSVDLTLLPPPPMGRQWRVSEPMLFLAVTDWRWAGASDGEIKKLLANTRILISERIATDVPYVISEEPW